MSISTISDIIKKVKMDNPYDETEAFTPFYISNADYYKKLIINFTLNLKII
jgi:hypothetical protein